MKKLAFFVEGQTEQYFIRSLVEACAGESNVRIELQTGNLGRKYKRIYMAMSAKNLGSGEDYFVLIINSGSDEGIISDIIEEYEGLKRENYDMIVGLRDVRPKFRRDEIDRLRSGLESAVSHLRGIPVRIYLSIMEIEAWFLAENTHFLRLSPMLVRERIVAATGLFPDNTNVEGLDVPSQELTTIYAIAGIVYDKSRGILEQIMDVLDFEAIVYTHSLQISDLGGVVQTTTGFFDT